MRAILIVTRLSDACFASLWRRGLLMLPVLTLFYGCATTIDGVPVPSGVQPLRADGGPVAPFTGVWTGNFDGVIRHLMFIESQRGEKVSAIYAIGAARSAGIPKTWMRLDGQVTDNRLRLDGDGFVVEYRLSRAGELHAMFRGSGSVIGHALMRRDLLPNLSGPGGPGIWSAGQPTMLATDMRESGLPVRLRTVIYRPAGSGPFPLAVINHGSTGSGTDPRIFRRTYADDQLAARLTSAGWLVAFVQRRGRGGSDGLYNEGFGADRSAGYSCLLNESLAGVERAASDIDAAVAALRRRADVQASPVLMAGLSRGGVLSAVWAARNPRHVAGVINFVGGWMGEACEHASTINQTLFREAAAFPGPMLWIYGRNDPFYSIEHSRANYQVYADSGGHGQWIELDVPGGNGHLVLAASHLWEAPFLAWLNRIAR